METHWFLSNIEGRLANDLTEATSEFSADVHTPEMIQFAEELGGVDPAYAVGELEIPRILRTEFNFVKFPFFDLAKNSTREEIKIEETTAATEGTLKTLWQVTRNVKGQFPGDFEKKVHRAVEQVINATPKPIQNPLRIGTLRSIARRMGINESGKNLNQIKRAFSNIKGATIKAHGTFQVKGSSGARRYLEDLGGEYTDEFNLYSRVIHKGRQLPNGETADCVHIEFGTPYLENINRNYVIPLDWDFFAGLKGTITSRMYELFCTYFFVALKRGYKYHVMKYSTLCAFLPAVQQRTRADARKQLKNAHHILTLSDYFSNVEWLDLTHDKTDWMLRYWIGDRARREYARNQNMMRQKGVVSTMGSLPAPQRQLKSTLKPLELPLTRALVQTWGFTHLAAQRLVRRHLNGQIHKVISWATWKRNHDPGSVTNWPGLITDMLTWEHPPSGFIAAAEKRQQANKNDQTKARRQAEQEAEKEREWQEWFAKTPQQRVEQRLEMWVAFEKSKRGGRLPSRAETRAKEAEYIASLPSPEQKQQSLFGYVKFADQV